MSNWKPLGEFIDECCIKCGGGDVEVSGIDINKQFISTRANLDGTDISKYYVVPKRCFACNLMHIGRDEKLPIAYNATDDNIVVTSAYYVFKIKDDKRTELLDEFLYITLSSKELDRLTWFYTDSSIRGNLKASRFKDILIPVPRIEVQRSVVAAWQGLREMQAQNERLAETLMPLCRSYLQDLKHKYKAVEIGEFIEQCDERNSDGTYDVNAVRGISIDKKVIPTKANMDGVSLTPYKLFKPKEFCFVTITSRNGGKISLACNEDQETHIVSSSYEVFRIKDHGQLDPGYLSMLFRRAEFDRYARFNSWGSAREAFSFADMHRVKIPLPPIEVQRAIVEVFRAAQSARRTAERAAALSKGICPALIQRAIHS